MRLTYHPEAEAELVEAARYDEGRSPGLGDRFLQEFDGTVAAILAAPRLWPVVESDLRCRAMEHFPFGIYDRVLASELRILAVKHHSRYPDDWRHRLND